MSRIATLVLVSAAVLILGLVAESEAQYGPGYYGGVYVVPGERYYAPRYRRYRPYYDRYEPRSYVRIRPPRPYYAPYGEPPIIDDDSDAYALDGRRSVQRRLNELGYDAGPVDGVYGGRTRAAMAAFQESIGTPVTGVLTAQEVELLYEAAPPPMHRSSLGDRPEAMEQPEVIEQPNAGEEPEVIEEPQLVSPPAAPEPRDRDPETTGTVVAQQSTDEPRPTIDGGDVITLPPGAVPRPLPRGKATADPFRDSEFRPQVFGVTTGTGRSEAQESLARNGYRECAEAGETLLCKSSNQSMNDTIAVAFARNQEGQPVYLVRRALAFNEPVQRSFLERQMAGRYPQLLADDDGVITSSQACGQAIGIVPGDPKEDPLEAFFNKRKTDAAVDDATLDLIDACPDYYAVSFDGEETVSNIEIVLFSSNAMRSEHSAALRRRRSERDEGASGGTVKF